MKFLAAVALVVLAGLGMAGEAKAHDFGFRTVPVVRFVTKFDRFGRPFTVRVVEHRRVAVRIRVAPRLVVPHHHHHTPFVTPFRPGY